MPVDRLPVILLGASVRAAAFSALRAGLNPWCMDLFADADLRSVAPVKRCSLSDYPRCFPEMLRDAPPGPVIYAGGLENHPQVVDRIAVDRPLWGNDAHALKKCRDPFAVSQLYRDAGIVHPMVARDASEIQSCLRKPRSGAGGANIAWAKSGDSETAFYYQQFVPGPSYSAVYCALADRVELLGITEQLVGEAWVNARPFQYCGSIGPIEVPGRCAEALKRIGATLWSGCHLRGLFGVDFVLHEEQSWPIEVNPRYTASIEVSEYATGLRSLEWHRIAFDPHMPILPASRGPYRCVGKAILFAPRRLLAPDVGWRIAAEPFVLPDIADVPSIGDTIEEGWPILTFFASGATDVECRDRLRARAREIQSALFPY